MTSATPQNKSHRKILWLLITVISITAIYIYFIDLDADPPMYFDGQSQSLSTDPHHYSYFARNKILFGQGELFDTSRWRVFEVTLISGISYILFSIFGISLPVANIPGPLSIMIAIALFILALRRSLKLEAAALVLILLLFNKVLHVYGRLPYAENGMILIMAMLFYIFMHHRHKLLGKIIIGIMAALAAMAGKIFGIIIIVPVITAFWLENKPDRIKNIFIVTASSIIFGAAWILIFYGGDLGAFYEYYHSQTLGLYGFPEAFKSPLVLIEKLVNFGNDSRFYFHSPVLGLAAFVALLAAFSIVSKKNIKENIPLIFLITWFVAGILLFMCGNYRPLRYVYMLYLPMAGMTGLVLSSSFHDNAAILSWKGYIKYILIFLLFWIVIEQIVFNIFYIGYYTTKAVPVTWFSFSPAVLIAYLEYRFNFLRVLKSRLLQKALVCTIVVLTFVNFALPYYDWQGQKSFNIREASRDLGQILADDAVICGPIAPTLLLENNLKGDIYAVGVTDDDPRFFFKNPVTHFVIDAMASGFIIEKYEELTPAVEIADYYIRDAKILVVDVSHYTGNKQAAFYQPTDYEIARGFMKQQVYDSALYYMESFIKKYPDNKSALRILGDLYPLNGKPDEAMRYLIRADSLYPTDFIVKLSLAVYYQKRYVVSGDDRFRHMARKTYDEVVEINPYQADEVSGISRRIAGIR